MELLERVASRWHGARAALINRKDALTDAVSSLVDSRSLEQCQTRKAVEQCIDLSLCSDCRRFTTDLLSKDVWAHEEGLFSAWPRRDASENPAYELRSPTWYNDDLEKEPCKLCRMLVHAWRQMDTGKTNLLTRMYIEVDDKPGNKFELTNDESTPSTNFEFQSDRAGTKWLERWKEDPPEATLDGFKLQEDSPPLTEHNHSTSATRSDVFADDTRSVSQSSSTSSLSWSPEPILPNSGSEDTIRMVREWMSLCCDQHVRCTRLSSKLPTRVIDVGTLASSPKLFVTHGEACPYLALSYCWGTKQSTVLRKATLADFQHSIPQSARPRTIEDAIIATRMLGFKYIWIDALCIVQDDPEDWQRESAVMATIYGHSHLTIAAAAAVSRHTGIFRDRHVRVTSAPLPCGSHMYVVQSRAADKTTEYHALQQRAWTLQEQIMSTAIVHFAAREVSWECREARISDDARKDDESRTHPILKGFRMDAIRHLPLGSSGRLWYHLVPNYALRSLTYETDRLIAIAGLAELCERDDWQTGRYLAGLWEDTMPAALLWRGRSRDGQRSFPTWSWAGSSYVDWPEHFLHGEATVTTTYDCKMGNGHYMSTDSKAAVTVDGHLYLDAWVQDHTEAMLNTVFRSAILEENKYVGDPITFESVRPGLSLGNEDLRLTMYGLRECIFHRPDRIYLGRGNPLFLARLCSWRTNPAKLDNTPPTSKNYIDTYFLMLERTTERTKPIQQNAIDVYRSQHHDGGPTTSQLQSITAGVSSTKSQSVEESPRLWFRRVGLLGFTHEESHPTLMENAKWTELVLV